MRNRAKCLLCNDIIESVSANDLVVCSCANVMITGGQEEPRYKANDWQSFVHVEDDGRLVKPVIAGGDIPADIKQELIEQNKESLSREQKLDMLDKLIEDMSMSYPVSNLDLIQSLVIVSSLLRD